MRGARGATLADSIGGKTDPLRPNTVVVAAAGLLLLGGAAALTPGFGWRQATLYLIGGALGLTLYHATFGFAASWRVFLADGRGAGLRAQMLMLAVATLLFFPVLADGTLFGRAVGGALAPVGVSVLVGAFVFGIGMQLGGACASGTLYTAGSGNTRTMLTLPAFIAGAFLATAHFPWWLDRPSYGEISIIREYGLGRALVLQLAVLAAIVGVTIVLERRRHGSLVSLTEGAPAGIGQLWRGPWPLAWGALALALLNFATLAVAGHAWSVTYGFTLWGAKLAAAAGLDFSGWTFWSWPYQRAALANSVFGNTVSVMNFGILAGALLAAGLAGRFAPVWRIPPRPMLAAVLGGLAMGYGARLAFGCNIGAFFSGVASGSLHGWLWLAAAMAGTAVGTALRPMFGLGVERSKAAA
ncbi:MAG: YeeE/YedE family protein [Inquilinus sp.]|nr:YeeE/YedE family protein [Inquilinus sp.]